MERKTSPNSQKWGGFIAADPNSVQAKIEKFRQDGPEKLVALIDFDGTVIPKSIWEIARSCLPAAVQQRLKPFVIENVTKLDNGTMTVQGSNAFTRYMLEAFRDPSLPPDTLARMREAMAKTALVPGAKDIFNTCEQSGVEALVVSASIQDFISIITTSQGVRPSTIVATPLEVERGRIASWDTEAMTHDLNKHLHAHKNLRSLTQERPNEIVIGNSPHDSLMATSPDALLIRVGGEKIDRQYIQESFHPNNSGHRPFDLIAVQPTLVATAGIFHTIVGR